MKIFNPSQFLSEKTPLNLNGIDRFMRGSELDNAEATGRQFAAYAIGDAMERESKIAAYRILDDILQDSGIQVTPTGRQTLFGFIDELLDIISAEPTDD